jgi:hypothetical protein
MMSKCLDCGETLSVTYRDHAYGYDRGQKIMLRGMKILSCVCGHSEVEIPRIGPLHTTIAQTLSALRAKREDLTFFFERGKKGVEDGEWGVVVRGAS